MSSERRAVRVNRESFADRPARDTAVTRALLSRVATGEEPETLRLHRPTAVVAFGPHDRIAPGYHRAIAAARSAGFGAIERLAGGRAAVFHEQTIAFAWTIPSPDPPAGIRQRFDEMSQIVADALSRLGIDARIGEVSGEYCPGEWSVNARGETKIMGVGQRLVRGAAHVGGVIVVDDSARVRDVLVPVYAELGLDWRPSSVGSVADEVGSGASASGTSSVLSLHEAVATAIVAELSLRHELVTGTFGPEIHTLADELEPLHLCPTQETA